MPRSAIILNEKKKVVIMLTAESETLHDLSTVVVIMVISRNLSDSGSNLGESLEMRCSPRVCSLPVQLIA